MYKKGESGNIKGRPKLTEEFKQLLNESTVPALKVINKIMLNKNAKDFDRIMCAKYILDKSLGQNFQLYEENDIESRNDMTIRIVSVKDKSKEKE